MKFIILLTFFATCLPFEFKAETIYSEDDISTHFLKYSQKTQTTEDVIKFEKIIEVLKFPNYINWNKIEDNSRASLKCITCRSVVSTVVAIHNQGASVDDLATYITSMCISLNIQSESVCRGIIKINAPIFDYILRNQPQFSSRSFCGLILQSSDNTCPYSDERYEWQISLPEPSDTQMNLHVEDKGTFKIAHISDTHYDPLYEPNGLADCDEPTCCRIGQKPSQKHNVNNQILFEKVYTDDDGKMYIDLDEYEKYSNNKDTVIQEKVEEISKPAGYWGDYRSCDTPWWSFEDGIEQMAKHEDIEFVYYTGDTIDHGVWETSKEMITDSLNDTIRKFKKEFGDKLVFPSIGNHESHPLNQYAPSSVTEEEVSTKWLYALLVELWGFWLPNDTTDSIMEGGYYSVLVKPGLRIIVLNSNLCYTYNWWIHFDPQDPSGQLKWLVDTLYEAEIAGEKVYIVSHIPAGTNSSYYVCAREYVKIIKRFFRIIIAEFNGHTHKDEFKIFYDDENTKPLLVAWNGGSLTPYSFVNPNYRIFEANSSSYDLINFDTYSYNLTDANLTPDQRPKWFKLYSFKDHYKVDSLKAVDVDKLVYRMVTTDKKLLVVDYHAFRGKYAPNYVDVPCDDRCVRSNLCSMVKTNIYDDEKCQELWDMFNKTIK